MDAFPPGHELCQAVATAFVGASTRLLSQVGSCYHRRRGAATVYLLCGEHSVELKARGASEQLMHVCSLASR